MLKQLLDGLKQWALRLTAPSRVHYIKLEHGGCHGSRHVPDGSSWRGYTGALAVPAI